jgi:hypothetical protein
MGKRKAYTPFSTSSEAGVTAAPVEGYIDVTQDVRPTIDTGFVDRKGQWIGHQTSDTTFKFYHKGNQVGNGEEELASTTDMTGFNDIMLALRVTNAGNFGIKAVMGPDTNSYANLNPVNAAATLKYSQNFTGTSSTFTACLDDSSEALAADVWNIFKIEGRLAEWKLLQFIITNGSGGASDIEIMYMRLL